MRNPSHHSSLDQGEQQLHGGAIATMLADRLTSDSTTVEVDKRSLGGGGRFPHSILEPVNPGLCQRDSKEASDHNAGIIWAACHCPVSVQLLVGATNCQ
jgi:hypothetical protein